MSLDTTISPSFPLNGNTPIATHTIYLALGSNLGDRRGNLTAALQQLRDYMEITTVSSLYETEPVGYIDQPLFLNMVCSGKTRLSAQELLKHTQEIELAIGRQPSFRNGPRPIDIDIIFYDNLHILQDNLIVPHERMAERAFVLVPMAEIAPSIIDPVSAKTVKELLAAVTQEGAIKIAANFRFPLEHAIQSGQPKVHVRLGRVG